jgi:hypothetical protein
MFVLRSLSNEVKKLWYVSDIGYRLRFPLGGLSGVAITWVLSMAQTPDPLKAVTPVAIAFLAGYSVELLFTAMDRLIVTFSGPESPPARPASA